MKELKTTVFADGFMFLEGPRWYKNQLWVVDMMDLKVLRISSDGKQEVVCEVPNRPSGLGFLPDGTPVVSSMIDRKVMKIEGSELTTYADLSELATGDANDIFVDWEGRVYVGNFGYDMFGGADPALADLILIDTDGSASVVASDLNFPNGMDIINNGKTLVVAETWANCLTAYDRAADGRLSNRRVFAELGERTPDGICSDIEGGIWVSSIVTGEVLRVLEGGEVTDLISYEGKRAAACVLGGDDGRTLFCMTFAGSIEEISECVRVGAIESVRVDIAGTGLCQEKPG